MDSKARQVHEDVKRSKKPDKNYTEAMQQYHEFCRTRSCQSEDARVAFDIYFDELQKEIVESLLFGDAEYDDIESAFGVTRESLDIYEELFFDRSKFRNKLDKLSYLENYPNKFGKELKMRAMNLGPEFVLYTYANIVPKTTDQQKLVQRMFMASAYKAMSMNYNSLDSKITKNAVDHAKLMLKAWEVLQKFNNEDITDDTDLVKVITKMEIGSGSSKARLVEASDIV